MNRDEILIAVEDAIQIAERFYDRSFERPKSIIFKNNGTTAGTSWYAKRELTFNIDIAENEGIKFLQTVKHEVAHWIQHSIYGYFYHGRKVMPHGKEWKWIMVNVYKIPADRCHEYDVSVTTTRQTKKYVWGNCGCNGRTYTLSSVKHNKGITGRARYRCPLCKSTISYIAPLTPANEIDKLKDLIAKMELKKQTIQNGEAIFKK